MIEVAPFEVAKTYDVMLYHLESLLSCIVLHYFRNGISGRVCYIHSLISRGSGEEDKLLRFDNKFCGLRYSDLQRPKKSLRSNENNVCLVTPFRYSSSTLAVLALKNVRFPRISMVLTKLQTEFKDG